MQIISTTKARQKLADLITMVRFSNKPIAIGRHNKAEALLIKFPEHINLELDELTNMNQYSGAFDFLDDEPDIYSVDDLKKSYV